jgi:hypothetical protein
VRYLTEEIVEVRSSVGSVSLGWTAIAGLRRHKGLILLIFRGAMYSIIPASQIPDAALSFMVEKCRAAGGKIADL